MNGRRSRTGVVRLILVTAVALATASLGIASGAHPRALADNVWLNVIQPVVVGDGGTPSTAFDQTGPAAVAGPLDNVWL